ncbi:MAG: hypothetical protein WCD18_07680 [Thermosynechococcaceae cyanobacterium]
MENIAYSVLSIAAIALLAVMTGGVIYLTLIEWRDRRQADDEKREARRR